MMGITRRLSRALAAVGLMVFVGAGPVAAQQPGQEPGQQPGQEPGQQPSQQQYRVQGELTAVDADAMSITVTANGQAVQIRYTDETEVSGAQDSIAGLATAEKAMVTVIFTEEGQTRTATRIEVQPAQ